LLAGATHAILEARILDFEFPKQRHQRFSLIYVSQISTQIVAQTKSLYLIVDPS
jgi:hypothetical protein